MWVLFVFCVVLLCFLDFCGVVWLGGVGVVLEGVFCVFGVGGGIGVGIWVGGGVGGFWFFGVMWRVGRVLLRSCCFGFGLVMVVWNF